MPKILTPNFDAIPKFLRQHPYWNAWAAVSRGSKLTKPPVRNNCTLAKTNDTTTWTDFANARAFYEARQGKILGKLNGPISGVGILLQSNLSLVGIDFDHVLDGEKIADWAKELIALLKQHTYCERSPSGTGVRSFLYGQKPSGQCRRGDLEIYEHARFLTVTGHKLEDSQNTLADGEIAQEIIAKLAGYLRQSREKNISTGGERGARNAGVKPQIYVAEPLTDFEVIEFGRKYTQGFSALFDSGDLSYYHNDRSAADLGLCNILSYWTAKDATQMDRLMRQSALLREPERLAKWDKIHSQGATYGEMTITEAIRGCHKVFERRLKKEGQSKKIIKLPTSNKPKIIYRSGELPRLVEELENSIRGKAWQRDTLLVRVINLPEKKSYHGLRMAKGTSVIAPFDVADLMLLANKCADWIKIKTTKDNIEEIPIDPPQVVLQAFLAAKGYWTLPPISGLVTCPIIRPDGSILDKPGYDKITGLYADFDAKDFLPVDIKPTKEAAQNSLVILKDALSEFAFKTDIDRSVALAAMLTAILRPSVRSAPLFAFSAPTPGTGKSTLANVIGIIATGRNCAAMDFNRDENEFKKAIFASLMEGSPVTLIDNIMGEFNSSLLNIILSEETIKGRVLGFSKNASLPTTSLWLATGNNLTICGDMTRRTLICTLDAEVEKPAERQFQRKNLEKWILDHRGELAHAALTILRAYHVAGKPILDDMKPMNGFNDWSHFVRGSLAWLGESDPKDSQLEIEAHDPEREGLRTVLHAWHDHFDSRFVTAKDLLAREAPDGGEVPDSQITLYQALLEAIPHGGELTSRHVGKWLAKYAGRVIDGLSFRQHGSRDKIILWQILKIK